MVNLVTGGAGFIGRQLVALLLARGERVRVFDIDAGEGLPPGVELQRGCIGDAEAVRRALGGARRLYHLAGNPNLWTRNRADFDAVNHQGTKVVLAEAGRCDLERIVFTSTESILCGQRPRGTDGATDETVRRDIGEMIGPYCRSKFLAEQEARRAAERGQPVVIVNPTLPVGPGDRHGTPPTRMLLGFLNGHFPAYLDCDLNMIDVRDVALGHVMAAERGRIGERYILGNRNIRLRELLDALRRLTGVAMPRFSVPYPLAYAAALVSEFLADHVTGRPPSAPVTGVRLARHPVRFDASKAMRELGLTPRPFEQTLAEAIEWLLEAGLIERALPAFRRPARPAGPHPAAFAAPVGTVEPAGEFRGAE